MKKNNMRTHPEDAGRTPDRLQTLLDEWQVKLELSSQFEAELSRRIASEGERLGFWRRVWMRVADPVGQAWWLDSRVPLAGGAAVLMVLLSFGVLLRNGAFSAHTPAPAGAAAVGSMAPAIHDLQVLSSDSDVLQNFDFLNGQSAAAPHSPESEN